MIVRFFNGRVALPAGAVGAVDVTVADGTVSAVTPAANTAADEAIDLDGGWLLPGFIDTQVNGGGGVLFNDQVDIDAIAAIGEAHARFGTTAFLPTLISDTPAQIAAALAAVDDAIAQGVPGVVGIHIEGPSSTRSSAASTKRIGSAASTPIRSRRSPHRIAAA
jgi:N-acetylglucosamine-6-phosphate deacetylase